MSTCGFCKPKKTLSILEVIIIIGMLYVCRANTSVTAQCQSLSCLAVFFLDYFLSSSHTFK